MIDFPHWITHPGSSTDPYGLLGISSGERDAKRIEEAAIERSAEARRYQLRHPLEASSRLEAIARAADNLMSRPQPVAKPRRKKRSGKKRPMTVVIVTQENGESAGWELKPRRLRLTGKKPAQGTQLLLLGADGKVVRLRLSTRSAEQVGALLASSAAVGQPQQANSDGKSPSRQESGGHLQVRV